MNRFKAVTHVIAGGLLMAVGFVASPQGQAILGPKWGTVVGLLVAAAAAAGVYHPPKEPRPIAS